jgi:nucleotide-binding universal stress UspA family protein
MRYRSIFCPVDFSPPSLAALRAALGLARRFGSHVTTMFVNDPLLLAAANGRYGTGRFVERTRTELARFVKRAVATTSAHQDDVELVVSVGNPAEEILRQAKRVRADLLVMGSHGLSGIPKALFGSTTEQVLRRANVPVLAIPRAIGSRSVVDFPTQVSRVIAPIDLTGEWQSDAVRAAAIAGELNATVVLVHVLAPVQSPPWARSVTDSHARHRIDRARVAMDRVRTRLFSDLESVSTLVLVGNPAHELARLTRTAGALVVMSLRGTAGVWGLRRGAIAYHLLTHSRVPVLALPRRRIGGRFAARARKAIGDVLTARDRAEMAGIDALLSIGSGRKPVRR